MNASYNFNRVFLAAGLGLLFFGIGFISLGSVLPSVIEKFEMDTVQAGLLAALLPMGVLLGSIIFGPLVDRYSYRIPFIVSSVLIIAGLESFAFSGNLHLLQVTIFFLGTGGGILNGGTNALVADISAARPRNRGANLSLLGAFFGLGALGVPLLLALLPEAWGYEWKIAAIGFSLVVPVLYFTMTRFPAPKQAQSISLRSYLTVLKDAGLLSLGMLLFFESALEGIINNWTTSYLQSGYRFPEARSLLGLSLFVLSLTVTRLLLAALLRRVRSYLVLLASMGLIFSAIMLLLLFPRPAFIIVSLVLLGAGAAAVFPVVLGYAGRLHSDLRGTAYSLVFSISLIGNILFNYLMGITAELFDIRAVPWVLMICLGFGAVLLAGQVRKYSADE